jgi:E3 ubiquitin-protein ligase MARCH6
MSAGINDLLPFLKLRFWHVVMPQLQVPVELLVFHLSMLALLEKYKNSIGEMQHHWLVFMCTRLGLAHFILPHEVEKFELVGHIPVFGKDLDVNPTLYALADETREDSSEDLIFQHLQKQCRVAPNRNETVGESRDSGERVLKASEAYISLPSQESTAGNNSSGSGVTLLSTKKGRYRLKLQEDTSNESMIEVWCEVPGKPIPRPPEGWDDLGAGGADIQGRWAWGKEKQSGTISAAFSTLHCLSQFSACLTLLTLVHMDAK